MPIEQALIDTQRTGHEKSAGHLPSPALFLSCKLRRTLWARRAACRYRYALMVASSMRMAEKALSSISSAARRMASGSVMGLLMMENTLVTP